MTVTAAALRSRLRSHAIPENVAVLQRFFKTGPGQYGDGDRFIGVKVPGIRAVCREGRDAPRFPVPRPHRRERSTRGQ